MENNGIEKMVYLIEKGDKGTYFTPSELPEVIERLQIDSKIWKQQGLDTWRVVRFDRHPRNGVVRIWFESIYYDAAYRPRVWRC